MHYVALIHGQSREVEITEAGPDTYHITVDGHRLDVEARACGPHGLHVLLDNRSYAVEIEEVGAEQHVSVRGHALRAEVLDLRHLRLRQAQENAAGPDGPASVTAPMPGKVVAVLVQEGASVEAGQGVVVVEAMKMENELRAPKSGIVRQVRATVGAAVESGAVLCVIE